ncbi:MAG: hypothetical protein IJQ12_03340 [Lachnospiraceae bacterium]|nr:hypothetical protein [Lachnospiraceae bacterium]
MRGLDVSVRTREQLAALEGTRARIARIYADAQLLLAEEDSKAASGIAQRTGALLFAAAPCMMREEEGAPDERDMEALSLLTQVRGILVRNMEQLAFLCGRGYPGTIVCDSQIYVFNSASFRLLKEQLPYERKADETTAAHELSLAQFFAACPPPLRESATVIVYGYTPMMVSAGCVRLTTEGCTGKKHALYTDTLSMTDRTGRQMRVTCDCRCCYNVIWNAHRLSLHREVAGLARKGVRLRLDFTTETGEECKRVLAFFAAILAGKEADIPYEAYTTGRSGKGVE